MRSSLEHLVAPNQWCLAVNNSDVNDNVVTGDVVKWRRRAAGNINASIPDIIPTTAIFDEQRSFPSAAE